MPANPSLSPGAGAGSRFDPGGRSVDSMFSRRQSATWKDPQDLKTRVKSFDFNDEEDEDEGSVSTMELDKLFVEWAQHILSEKDNTDEGLLPFKVSAYFDINSDEEDFVPDVDFYLANTRLRGQNNTQSDYEKAVLHQRPTTPGLGTGRATGRTRSDFSQANVDHTYPGKPRKMSYKDLRDLIKTEMKNIL
tara:strand:+ start:1943 stop:2515 length:573 start_codon:yes stop_codon:yes gene_type:complete